MKPMPDKCADGTIWSCRKVIMGKRHQRKISIRHGSLFFGFNLPIRQILHVLYEWGAKTGIDETSYQIDMSRKTVRKLFRAFRGLASWAVKTRLSHQLGGQGKTIEVDECQVGRRKHHRGRMPKEMWVFGAIERGSNPPKCFIEVVAKRNRDVLTEVISRRIHSESTIVSDGWRAYNQLAQSGLDHRVINHSKNFVDPKDQSIHTQNVENLWRCLRRFLSTKGTYTRRHMREYLDEFVFRKSFISIFEVALSVIEEKFPVKRDQ
jgi:transposase-like protein